MSEMQFKTIRMGSTVLKGGQWVGANHFYWPAPNTVGRVPAVMADDVIARGWAEEVDDPEGNAPFPGHEYTESP